MTDEELAVDQNAETEEEKQELSEEEQALAKLKEAISVEQAEIGALRLKLTITIPRTTLDERMGEQFADLKRDAMVPGFRKGHAPMKLVEKRFGTEVGQDIKSQLIGQGYLAAVEKEDLKILGDPLFWAKAKKKRGDDRQPAEEGDTEKLLPLREALGTMELPKEGDLTFSCEVELKPEFELPELTKIPVQHPKVTVDKDDVEAEIKRLQMSRGTFKPVKKGPVELDDMLYGDMKLLVDDKVLASEENFDLAARDMRLKGIPLAGFGEVVAGKNIGDTVTFEAPVPDDHEDIDARGKTAKLEFKVNEIKRLEVPPIDDALLESLGVGSEKELREAMKSMLDSRLDRTLRRARHEQIGQYLIDNTKLEIPEGLSQRQTDRTVTRRMIELYQMGTPQPEIEKVMDEMRAGARERTIRDLKLFFILEKIAEERSVEVAEERINAAIAEIAQRMGKRFDRARDELSKGDGLTTLYLQLRDEQVLDGLLEDAEITELEGPKKKAPAKKKASKKKKTSKKKTS